MSQKEIEIILARHLSSYLAAPIFIADPQGNLLYYNEAAEAILGRRFDETGEMPLAVWGTIFEPVDKAGNLLPPDQLPLAITLATRRASQGSFWIRGLDNVLRYIEVTAYPLVGQANRYLGAFAIFSETRGA
jgi:PAS domain-containing protein